MGSCSLTECFGLLQCWLGLAPASKPWDAACLRLLTLTCTHTTLQSQPFALPQSLPVAREPSYEAPGNCSHRVHLLRLWPNSRPARGPPGNVVSCDRSRNSGNYSSAFQSDHVAVGEEKSGSARTVAMLEGLLTSSTRRAPPCRLVNRDNKSLYLLGTSLAIV